MKSIFKKYIIQKKALKHYIENQNYETALILNSLDINQKELQDKLYNFDYEKTDYLTSELNARKIFAVLSNQVIFDFSDNGLRELELQCYSLSSFLYHFPLYINTEKNLIDRFYNITFTKKLLSFSCFNKIIYEICDRLNKENNQQFYIKEFKNGNKKILKVKS